MRNLVRNSVLVILATLIAIAAIIPPDKKLRGAKDLTGGFNVVYQVDIRAEENPRDVLEKVIQVVHDRLDPKGLLDISIVAQGNDRIEISMPLPRPEVKALLAKFDEELARLSTGSVAADEFERVIRLPADQRSAQLQALAGGDAERLRLFQAAAAAFDAAQTTRPAYEEQKKKLDAARERLNAAEKVPESVGGPEFVDLLRAGVLADEQALDPLALALASAELAYEKARDDALASVISPAEVRRALRLSNDKIKVRDETQSDQIVELDSPREVALKRLRQRHPSAVAQLDRVVAAWNAYETRQSTLNDPSDLIRLLKGAGVLTFRITVDRGTYAEEGRLRELLHKVGPANARSDQARWFKINKIQNWYSTAKQVLALQADPAAYFAGRGFVGEEYDGEYYFLCWDRPGMRLTPEDGQWTLASARQGQDQLGRPAIDFQMDRLGADRMRALTEKNINNSMAVLLDDEIYTAPNINGAIGGSGQIMGDFSPAELQYIIRVLASGSLQAKLSSEPISASTIAPELGADNLRRGLVAGAVAFVACSAFMVVYYFSCGLVSVLALLLNALFVVGAMAIQNAAFSLPGIAGVVLTFGMAVDANVLIYERMREELQKGLDLKTAVRLGYEKALASIVDGNLTTLIPCIVLGFTGTQEIKGFAITLGIGNVMILFTQLFVTRLLFAWLVEYTGVWKRASMLPIAVPAIHRMWHTAIDWMRLRYVFMSVSLVLTGASVVFMFYQGSDMLDNEFLGGTKVTLQLKETAPGKRITMTRADVEKTLKTAAEASDDPVLKNLQTSVILVVNPEADGVTSSVFAIKTVLTDAKAVQAALIHAFANVVDAQPRLSFDRASVEDPKAAPVYPILDPVLGKNVDRPDVVNDVRDFIGGAAIVLDNINPPVPLASIPVRLAQLRSQTDFQDIAARDQHVVRLAGTESAVTSAVILVKDPAVSFQDNQQQWESSVQAREWKLATSALTQITTLASVESFSAQIAQTFRAQAILAVVLSTVLVVIYVWVRFGSIRYSGAAIITTLHDCLVAVGAIAFAEILFDNAPGVATTLGIMPFKVDLNLVAAVLTILGYSLNDTIIVMDRIRENKGKLPNATRSIINGSINMTISRTVITSSTTGLAALVLYLYGGEAVRGFAYAMLVGVVVGTYSSIAVASPLVWSEAHETHHRGGPPGAGATVAAPTMATV